MCRNKRGRRLGTRFRANPPPPPVGFSLVFQVLRDPLTDVYREKRRRDALALARSIRIVAAFLVCFWFVLFNVPVCRASVKHDGRAASAGRCFSAPVARTRVHKVAVLSQVGREGLLPALFGEEW